MKDIKYRLRRMVVKTGKQVKKKVSTTVWAETRNTIHNLISQHIVQLAQLKLFRGLLATPSIIGLSVHSELARQGFEAYDN